MTAILDNNDNIIGFSKGGAAQGIDVSMLGSLGTLKTKLDILKAMELLDIRKSYQAQINSLREGYNDYEIESFSDQRFEWKAWKQDDTIATPITDALATSRGIDRKDLLNKIGNNVLYIVGLQGKQNAVEDSIKACSTEEELTLLMSELLQ